MESAAIRSFPREESRGLSLRRHDVSKKQAHDEVLNSSFLFDNYHYSLQAAISLSFFFPSQLRRVRVKTTYFYHSTNSEISDEEE